MTNLEYIYNASILKIVGLTEDRSELEKYLICSDKRPDRSKLFVRDTPLSLARLLSFMIMPRAGSCQSELEFFYSGIGYQVPSKSAFSMKRKYISPDIFLSLNTEILDDFYRQPNIKKWKGRYIIAIDGTTLTMPVGSRFESLYGSAKLPQNESIRLPTARIVIIMDVLNNQILKIQLGQYGSHEPELALEAIKALPEYILQNAIFIFDRLYLSSWLLTILQNNGIQYVMRCRRNFSPAIDEFFESKRKSCDAQLKPSSIVWKQKTSDRFDKMGITPSQHRPLFIHLTKSELPDGNMEVICSWTKDIKISAAQSYALYGRRWNVETAIGFEKNEWQIEIFSGYSKIAILQDIYCKIVSYNLCSIATSEADKKLQKHFSKSFYLKNSNKLPVHRILHHRVNVNMALFLFKRLLVQIVCHKKTLHSLILKYIDEIGSFYHTYSPRDSLPRHFAIYKAHGKYATFTNYARVL